MHLRPSQRPPSTTPDGCAARRRCSSSTRQRAQRARAAALGRGRCGMLWCHHPGSHADCSPSCKEHLDETLMYKMHTRSARRGVGLVPLAIIACVRSAAAAMIDAPAFMPATSTGRECDIVRLLFLKLEPSPSCAPALEPQQ